MSWHKGTRKMICRTRMFALPHTFGPIKLLAYLVEALWFPGQTFSNGQFSCRVAPLCLLGLEVRTGRWSAVSAWIVVATLFQTCFRPVSDPRKSMHGAGVSACALGSCPQKPPNGLDAVEDMGAGWCVSTPINPYQPIYLSIYVSIYLSVSINIFFHFTYLFKDAYIKMFFNIFSV